MHGWHLFMAVAAILPSDCQAKIPPMASTVTASRISAASGGPSHSDDAGGATDSPQKKRMMQSPLRMPKPWGRSGRSKTDTTEVGDDGDKEPETKSTSAMESKSETDSDGGTDEVNILGDDEKDEVMNPSSPDLSNADDEVEPVGKENTSRPQSSDEDDSHSQQQQQPTNQTRPGVLYFTRPPTRLMPYMVPSQQNSPPRNNPPSLISSILSLLLPRPQNMPPPPYGPPMMPPSSPYGPSGNSPILSLVLRLALISLGTLFLDIFGLGSHSDAFLPGTAQHYTFERVNDRYRKDGSALRLALGSPPPGVGRRRWKRAFGRKRRDAASTLMLAEESISADGIQTQLPPDPASLTNGALYNRTVIIVEMKPDSRVGNGIAEQLRDTVSFLIEQHRDHVDVRHRDHANAVSSKLSPSKFLPRRFSRRASAHTHRTPGGIRTSLGTELEVVLFLDSPGGTVQDYGLASSHLSRLRNEPHVTLSVCVDRVAASGGYMMACQATPGRLFAAPFAMLGSIGVLMETVNVNEILKKYGVRPLVIKAGKNKAPLKTLGEVTQEELKMAQDDADVIHEAFQQWVLQSRPNVVVSPDWVEKVCTGSVFLGKEAQELGLVDRVLTSDEYVAERIAAGDRVLRLMPYRGPQFGLMKISPLDLLLSGMDAEGRAKIRTRMQALGSSVLHSIAPLFRVGAAVGVLNHLALLQSHRQDYHWTA